MSAQKEHQLNPSDLTDEQLDRLAFALIGRISKYSTDGGFEKPLTREKAAEFIGLSVDTIDKMKRDKTIEAHYFHKIKVPFYYASEINEVLKRKQKRS